MEPKHLQDAAAPKAPGPQAAPPPVQPPSGPELVGDIPVRAPAGDSAGEQQPAELQDHEEKKPGALPIAAKKDGTKPVGHGKPKPVAAIVVATAAVICLAAGAYFQFLTNR